MIDPSDSKDMLKANPEKRRGLSVSYAVHHYDFDLCASSINGSEEVMR